METFLDFLREAWFWLVLIVDRTAATAVTIHAVLYKRETRAVIGWVGLAWLAPIVGSLAYFCFGINRIQRKGLSLQLRQAWQHKHDIPLQEDDIIQSHDAVARHPNLVGLEALGRHLTNHELLPGNSVQPLVDGDEAYPAMLQAIDAAEKSVALQSYIFDSDRAGVQFLEALTRAKDRGVQVRVLIDGVGVRYSKVSMADQLQAAGIEVALFLPTRTARLFRYANLRNHRKILVVDGRIGFTGGTNIREGHCLKLNPGFPVQCLHFRLEGPVVLHMQEAFAIDWAFASGETLKEEIWFPEAKRVGGVWARGIPDGPDEDIDKLTLTIIGALAEAKEHIQVVTPYFLPDSSVINALNTAALRGVKTQIVLPSHNNIPLVHWASQALWEQLLERGCQIYISAPPFDHSKLLIVDGVWTLLGSTNWDPRSLRLNFEYNVECYGEPLAQQLNAMVNEKIQNATCITMETVQSRSLPIKLRDGFSRLLSPYL